MITITHRTARHTLGVARRLALAVCAAAPLAAALPAMAQQQANPAMRAAAQACAPDIRSYCGQAGRGEMRSCLQQNASRLSLNCQQALQQAQQSAPPR